jgi:hypothetical protein
VCGDHTSDQPIHIEQHWLPKTLRVLKMQTLRTTKVVFPAGTHLPNLEKLEMGCIPVNVPPSVKVMTLCNSLMLCDGRLLYFSFEIPKGVQRLRFRNTFTEQLDCEFESKNKWATLRETIREALDFNPSYLSFVLVIDGEAVDVRKEHKLRR